MNTNASITPTIGIDLGTSQSAGCYDMGINPQGMPVMKYVVNELIRAGEITRGENEKYYPSYVQFDLMGHPVTAGVRAKRLAETFRRSTVYDAKRFIGRRYDDPKVKELVEVLRGRDHFELCDDRGDAKVRIEESMISAEEVGSEIIAQILKDAFQQERGLVLNRLVLSVPAYFGDVQKARTKGAAVLAIKKLKAAEFGGRINIDVDKARLDEISDMTLIAEPTASLIAFMAKGGTRFIQPGKYVLVFDLGAGTLDITIGTARVVRDPIGKKEKYAVDIKWTYGNTSLGGRDMDQRVIDFVRGELARRGIAEAEAVRREVRDKAEEAKIKLSSRESVDIKLMEGDIRIPLSRAKLEELIGDILGKCRGEIRAAMKGAGIKKGDISAVVMVGGPTFMPSVRKLVEEEVGIPITTVEGWDPMTCVSEGAARSPGTLVMDVVPFDYYISVSMFNGKNVATMIAAAGEKANLDKSLEIEVPISSSIKIERAVLRMIEVKHEEGSARNSCIQDVELPVASLPQKGTTRVINYTWDVADLDQYLKKEIDFVYGKISVKCRVNGEGLLVDPVFFDLATGKKVIYPSLPVHNMGGIEYVEAGDFTGKWESYASGYLRSVDTRFEEQIRAVMGRTGCNHREAVETIVRGMQDIDPEPPGDDVGTRMKYAHGLKLELEGYPGTGPFVEQLESAIQGDNMNGIIERTVLEQAIAAGEKKLKLCKGES